MFEAVYGEVEGCGGVFEDFGGAGVYLCCGPYLGRMLTLFASFLKSVSWWLESGKWDGVVGGMQGDAKRSAERWI